MDDANDEQTPTNSKEIPAHRSHDPNNNLKRSDPFAFGSRYLQPGDDVYEFNAWDHVLPDETFYEYAEAQYSAQRAFPVSEFDKIRFNREPAKWWNKFYSNNTSNFFKDRKWLHQEFPILSKLTRKDAAPATILEVGAGAGNTAFPILRENENKALKIHACDFSKTAVDLMKRNDAFDQRHMVASVWDVSGETIPEGVEEQSVDVVLLIFIFSALSPQQWTAAVRNVWKVLKPGGEVCFRDYGKGDLTQVRFKKGRLLEDNFYIRGDGTRVYFFEEDELRRIWGGLGLDPDEAAMQTCECAAGYETRLKEHGSVECKRDLVSGEPSLPMMPKTPFEISSLAVDRRMLVNRQKQLKMHRCWIQGRFKKPDFATAS